MHDYWGGAEYWMARRSMRFNSFLVETANNYRLDVLNSTDEFDGIHRPRDWRNETVTVVNFFIHIHSKFTTQFSLSGASHCQRRQLLMRALEKSRFFAWARRNNTVATFSCHSSVTQIERATFEKCLHFERLHWPRVSQFQVISK